MAPLIVTGYVPLKDHPRSTEEYRQYGAQLTELPGVKLYENELKECWMYEPAKKYAAGHAQGDNPTKNTLGYHVVQHQKTQWLGWALLDHPHADPLIWVDYGVFRLPGVTAKVIREFIGRIAKKTVIRITLPGCWSAEVDNHPLVPCWRFCGTVAIVPRSHVGAFDVGARLLALDGLKRERFATWEVNTWAKFERLLPEIFHWYEADHNATLFTHYRPSCATSASSTAPTR